MRSSLAIGPKSFLKPEYKEKIEQLIQRHAKATGTTIYDNAKAGNHLHFILRIQSPKLFKKFLRSITGLIARLILKAEKAHKKA